MIWKFSALMKKYHFYLYKGSYHDYVCMYDVMEKKYVNDNKAKATSTFLSLPVNSC